jgi:division protein CdvB (Snf7/Vps24/ESCRT-III family)
MRLLELTVATRYAASRLGLLASRVRATYMRTRDESLLKLLNNILHIQSVLEIMSIRLETLATVGVVSANELRVVKEVLARIRGEYAGIQPMIDSVLLELENMASSIAAETGIEPMPAPAQGSQPVDPAIEKILEEAKAIADARTKEIVG